MAPDAAGEPAAAELPDVPGIDVASLFLPAIAGYEVGGDFYDVFELDDGRWVALVGDVCGKGVEAAALTGLARHTLRAVANVERPSEALVELNRALLRERIDGRFCTAALAYFEPPTAMAPASRSPSAGHPLPQLVCGGRRRPAGRASTARCSASPRSLPCRMTTVILERARPSCCSPTGSSASARRRGPESLLRSALRTGPAARRPTFAIGSSGPFGTRSGSDQFDDVAVLVLMAR